MSEYIGKRYRIIKNIGKGGMADVYLALDTILNREVAIKVLKGELSSDPVSLERFKREAHAATCLSHPNIVDIYDVGEDDSKHYIVMEYIKGYTLKQLIKKRGPLPYKEAVWLMKQLSGALMEAHRNGVIHRDIKSQNILIKADGTIKIADFGIALAHDAIQITSKDSILGSVHYLAPELTKGGQANMQSDIYSLGIVFFEMLTGDIPFKGDQAIQVALKHIKDEIPSVRLYNDKIPQSVENIVLKSTAKDLKERYENVAFMLMDLNKCLDKEHLNDKKIVLNKVNDEEFLSKVKVTISGEAKKTNKKDNKKISNAISIGYIVVGILTSLILIIGILFMSGVIGQKNNFVTVPDITNLSIIEANDMLSDYSISVDLSDIERIMTDNIEEGKIIDYYPKDTEVEKGSKIHVIVSSGKYEIMQDYYMKDVNEACDDLRAKKFDIELKQIESDLKPGTVVKQEGFVYGDKYNPNVVNKIILYYSEYPSLFLSFDLIGRDVNDVKNELENQGMKVELTEISTSSMTAYELEKYPPMSVVRMSPEAGSMYTQENDKTIKLYYYIQ